MRAYVDVREPRVLALDPFHDFSMLRQRLDPEDAIAELAEGGPCRRRLVPPRGQGSIEYAEEVFRLLIEREVEDILLVMDELTLWTKREASPALTFLTLQGRQMGIRIAAATQRIGFAPHVFLGEVTEFVLFNVIRPRDLEAIEEWTDPETAEIVRKLRVGECLVVMP